MIKSDIIKHTPALFDYLPSDKNWNSAQIFIQAHANFICYRKLQDRVDKLEADKESLVNHIYDLRQLLQKINADGEAKLVYLKGKNLGMKTEIAQLLKALEISRKNSIHFAQVASYWSYCVNTNSFKNTSDDDDCFNQSTTTTTNTKTSTTKKTVERFHSSSSNAST